MGTYDSTWVGGICIRLAVSLIPPHSSLCILCDTRLEFMVCEIQKASLESSLPPDSQPQTGLRLGDEMWPKLHLGCFCVGSAFPRVWGLNAHLLPVIIWVTDSRKAAHFLTKSAEHLGVWGDEGRKTEPAWEVEDSYLKAKGLFFIFYVNFLTFKTMRLLLGLWFSNISS